MNHVENVVRDEQAVWNEDNSSCQTETGIDKILTERGKRYGTFAEHAEISQDLKRVVFEHLVRRKKTLAPDQTEALEMVCHKMARIINGDSDYVDSWSDIAGYAKLIADRLDGNSR